MLKPENKWSLWSKLELINFHSVMYFKIKHNIESQIFFSLPLQSELGFCPRHQCTVIFNAV